MPLGFSHFPVGIRKQALLDRLVLLPAGAAEVSEVKRLLASHFADAYLVGLDDIASEDGTTLNLLALLCLVWHRDGDCIDYFVWGSCPAPWLEHTRVAEALASAKNQPSGFWHAYRHVDDKSTKLVFEGGYAQPLHLSWD